ncbi:hypothetical protein CSB45_03845 [candidate division KSB3 bacterium]|uniref:SIS domain-containing protein n=1 Tax=candidate division KSB3 bacterium TaxID=2044937 RepID=A0A2G6E7Z0_9BACT|nr:MAG: hypothetical protein CSB45_03845 [candidate division KSB3 bacterium]PIE30515.1 MAG: hypothetical protein CSA57_02435 [candidate division KSB3 bacterium]
MKHHDKDALSGIDRYFTIVMQHLEHVLASQRSVMERVAVLWAETIHQDHLIYVFGSGHSRYIAGELFFRAGGLGAVMLIDDPAEGMAERVEGYAANFMGKYDIQPGDLLVVASQSGINPVPIEVALEGKRMGAAVLAVTSLAHSQVVQSRHSSGHKLYEVSDIVLDTMVPKGDAVVELPNSGWRVSPVSTIISVAILNAIVAQTACNLEDLGTLPPVFVSANLPEGDVHNQQVVKKYWQRLARFPMLNIQSG